MKSQLVQCINRKEKVAYVSGQPFALLFLHAVNTNMYLTT